MTTGFLGLTTGQMSEILEILDQLDSYAAHPALLPILMYSVCSSMLRRQLRSVHEEMDIVQRQTGLLDRYLKAGKPTTLTRDHQKEHENPDYDLLHQTLVEQHAQLTTGLSDFVTDLGLACFEVMEKIEESNKGMLRSPKTKADIELHSYLSQLRNAASFELQHRERMLSRIEMQLKVVRDIPKRSFRGLDIVNRLAI